MITWSLNFHMAIFDQNKIYATALLGQQEFSVCPETSRLLVGPPTPFHLSHWVKDPLPALSAGGGQMVPVQGSLASVTLPQGSCIYHQCVTGYEWVKVHTINTYSFVATPHLSEGPIKKQTAVGPRGTSRVAGPYGHIVGCKNTS